MSSSRISSNPLSVRPAPAGISKLRGGCGGITCSDSKSTVIPAGDPPESCGEVINPLRSFPHEKASGKIRNKIMTKARFKAKTSGKTMNYITARLHNKKKPAAGSNL